MEFISYSISILLAYTGLFFGLLLGKIAKSELRDGKKYFILLQNILVLIILIVFILSLINNKYLMIFLIVLIIVIFMTIYSKSRSIYRNLIEIKYAYIIFGALIFFINESVNHFFIILSLIFIFGLPSGSIILYEKKRKYNKLLINGSFVLIAIIFYLSFNFL